MDRPPQQWRHSTIVDGCHGSSCRQCQAKSTKSGTVTLEPGCRRIGRAFFPEAAPRASHSGAPQLLRPCSSSSAVKFCAAVRALSTQLATETGQSTQRGEPQENRSFTPRAAPHLQTAGRLSAPVKPLGSAMASPCLRPYGNHRSRTGSVLSLLSCRPRSWRCRLMRLISSSTTW
jgi:hypothetical protein